MHKSTSNNDNTTSTELREKTFKIRNSPLTDRYENNKDVRTIYNLFLVILINFVIHTFIYDYMKAERYNFGLRLVLLTFNKFDSVLLIWMTIYAITWLVYLLFLIWARIRVLLKPKLAIYHDRFFIILLFSHYLLSLYGIQKVVSNYEFNPGSAAILMLDQVRLLMKQHAFVRTNAPKILAYKPHSEQTLHMPKPRNFLYFTFAPTLLYRDNYPRTASIRWKFVMKNLLEIFGIILLLSVVVERCLLPSFGDYGLRKFKKNELLLAVFGNLFAGTIFLLSAFYSVLHANQNLFAELLRFGDRLFYDEWWNCRSLSEYYRKWNIVVHDWLYYYVYKDMYEIVVPKNRQIAKLAVFLLSALVHEWIVMNVLNLFFPLQFIQFFLCGAFLQLLNIIHVSVGNFIVWYCIVIGCAVQVNLYAVEYLARYNSPIQNPTVIDFFLPRFLTCNCIE